MVAAAITGNISAEATTPTGNTFVEATRGGGNGGFDSMIGKADLRLLQPSASRLWVAAVSISEACAG